LENVKEVIKEFKKEYRQDQEDVARQEHKEGIFKREELPGRFTAKRLFGWSDKRYDEEYWGRLERNWKQWKGGQPKKKITMETIKKEEEIEQEKSRVREWMEEDNNEMGNMVDPYYKL